MPVAALSRFSSTAVVCGAMEAGAWVGVVVMLFS